MTLEQAIDRYTNNAKYERIHGSLQGCMEFRQLAEWLKDYKRLLEQQPVTTTNNDEPITVIYPTIVCTETGCFVREPKGDYVPYIHYDDVIKCIKGMPPVTQKYGKWIAHSNGGIWIKYYECSECGKAHDTHSDYCPNCGAKMQESEEAQPKQTDGGCLDLDFDKVKEILKRDDFDDLIVDHTCEEKQEQTRDEKMIDDIDFAIKATNSQDDYSMGMRNGMRYVKSLIDGKEPQYELRWTDEEIKLGIDLGDEVVDDLGAKGVVVGIDTYKGEVLLSLLMRNHKVPQLVKASRYKTKTGRHFSQIIEVLEQIKGEADGK